ncbi:MAG: hypothetical protein R3190_15260 [Thermoanaerobaculia bacterium]|nr:hypothetical protein [Thermoanaerobaculia bacterium]
MIPLVVSSPGKLILVGEHAAVYGRPAVVAALGARTRVRLEAGADPGVDLRLDDIGYQGSISAAELVAYAREAERRWLEFDRDPSPQSFRRVRGEDPAHLAKVALGEALAHAGSGGLSWRLSVCSELPVGSGFGSSAALASALILGVLEALDAGSDLATLERLVTEAERRQHGHPSGIDAAVVLRGGVQSVQRRGDGLAVSAVAAGEILDRLRVVDTGAPATSTGEVVAGVRRFAERSPRRFERAVDEIGAAAGELTAALEEGDGPRLGSAITRAQRSLELLGVVPAAVRDLVRRIEDRGGAAKVSGAGASSGDRAGGVLVYHPRAEEVATWDFLAAGSLVAAGLGAPPVCREESG